MLIYVDAPKFIKVFREKTSAEGARRVRLGIIFKGLYEFRADTTNKATADEQAEIAKAIETMQSASQVQARADALRFPEIARHVAEYYESGASDFEKGLISVASLEMIRTLRRADKGKQ
jgi:hypothetical protein